MVKIGSIRCAFLYAKIFFTIKDIDETSNFLTNENLIGFQKFCLENCQAEICLGLKECKKVAQILLAKMLGQIFAIYNYTKTIKDYIQFLG